MSPGPGSSRVAAPRSVQRSSCAARDRCAQRGDHRRSQRRHARVARRDRDLGPAQQRVVDDGAHAHGPAVGEVEHGADAGAAQPGLGARDDRPARPQGGERRAVGRRQRARVAARLHRDRVERNRPPAPVTEQHDPAPEHARGSDLRVAAQLARGGVGVAQAPDERRRRRRDRRRPAASPQRRPARPAAPPRPPRPPIGDDPGRDPIRHRSGARPRRTVGGPVGRAARDAARRPRPLGRRVGRVLDADGRQLPVLPPALRRPDAQAAAPRGGGRVRGGDARQPEQPRARRRPGDERDGEGGGRRAGGDARARRAQPRAPDRQRDDREPRGAVGGA